MGVTEHVRITSGSALYWTRLQVARRTGLIACYKLILRCMEERHAYSHTLLKPVNPSQRIVLPYSSHMLKFSCLDVQDVSMTIAAGQWQNTIFLEFLGRLCLLRYGDESIHHHDSRLHRVARLRRSQGRLSATNALSVALRSGSQPGLTNHSNGHRSCRSMSKSRGAMSQANRY